MEDVFTIRVKSKPDKKDLYPSERRYSASTVSGLAWVHITLAATCFLLSCLTFINPGEEPVQHYNLEETTEKIDAKNLFETTTSDYYDENTTETYEDTVEEVKIGNNNHLLVVASCFVCVFALSAAVTGGNASIRWYIDKNITWFFIASVLSSAFCIISCTLIIIWLVHQPETTEASEPNSWKGYFNLYRYAVLHKNDSHILLAQNATENDNLLKVNFKKRVLAINVLIAAMLETLWSLLSVKIAYKGMISDYKDEDTASPNDKISVITTTKGNIPSLATKTTSVHNKNEFQNQRSTKNINQVYLANDDKGYFLRSGKDGAKHCNAKAEYNERINDYLKRRSSIDSTEPSVKTETSDEGKKNSTQNKPKIDMPSPDLTKIGWNDTLERAVFNQNNVNFDAIFNNYLKQVKQSENIEK